MASSSEAPGTPLAGPRMEERKALLVAGLMKTFTPDTVNEIQKLWQELTPHFGKIPGEVGHKAYGVVYNMKNSTEFASWLASRYPPPLTFPTSSALFASPTLLMRYSRITAMFPV